MLIGIAIRNCAKPRAVSPAPVGHGRQEIVALESSASSTRRAVPHIKSSARAWTSNSGQTLNTDASLLLDSMLSLFYMSVDSLKSLHATLMKRRPTTPCCCRVDSRRQLLASLLFDYPRLLDKRATARQEITLGYQIIGTPGCRAARQAEAYR